MIAALYVMADGIYSGRSDADFPAVVLAELDSYKKR